MIGVMMFSTIELTICVNAAPMTTATARSMTLPRRMNALNPSTRSLIPEPSPEPVELASGAFTGTLTSCHEGARRGTPKTHPSPSIPVHDALGKGEQTAQGAGYSSHRGLWVGGLGVICGSGLWADVLTLLTLDGVAVAHHPEVDVGLGVFWEPLSEPALAGDFDNRAVDVLIPVGDRLLIGHRFVADGGQPVAMPLNMDPDFIVAAKRRGPDVMVGTEAIKVGAAQKLGVLRLQQKLIGGHAGVERGPDVPFDHLGVDELLTAFTGDADPVITVLDEVDVTDFVQLDRRQIDVLIVGAVDALPAAGGKALTWEELAGEILKAVHAADDL